MNIDALAVSGRAPETPSVRNAEGTAAVPVAATDNTFSNDRFEKRAAETSGSSETLPPYSPLEMGPKIVLKEAQAIAEIPRTEPTANKNFF